MVEIVLPLIIIDDGIEVGQEQVRRPTQKWSGLLKLLRLI